MKYYHRNIENELLKAVKQFRVIILTGARQTGKSTLLENLFKNKYQYVSLDDPKNLKLASNDPELFFTQYKPPLIIDEIQYAPQILSYIKMLADKSNKRGQFILTGSQQFKLMKNVQETLAGRAALYELHPMAIDEGPLITQNYEFRALNGSFPELVTIKNINSEKWFSSYISTYIERDVQTFYKLEKITYFKDLIFLLAARCSQILNYQSIASDLGLSITAIKLWVKILQASQIITLLQPYYVNLGSRITKAPKVYFNDIGLVSYVIGNNNKKSLFQGIQAGPLFENFVIQEIIKKFGNLGKNAPLYYYRTNNGLEIDIIIEKKPGILIPCEIKLSKTPHADMGKPIDRLRNLNKNKNITIANGIIISSIDKKYVLSQYNTACNLIEFLNELPLLLK